jgi:hypothetical protein
LLAAELHEAPPSKAEVQTFNEVQSTVEGLLEQLESADPANRGRELENARLAYAETRRPSFWSAFKALAARSDEKSAARAHAAAGEAVTPLIDAAIARLRPLAFRLIDGAARRFEVVADRWKPGRWFAWLAGRFGCSSRCWLHPRATWTPPAANWRLAAMVRA